MQDCRVNEQGFAELKADGKLSFGQLPALEIEHGPWICQSAAILRYVGRYAGLYPTHDPIQAAIIDSLMDEEIDLFTGISVTRYRSKFQKSICGDYYLIYVMLDRMGFGSLGPEHLGQISSELSQFILPKHLGFLENFLEKSPSGWLAGGQHPSIADFCFVPRLLWLVKPGTHEGIDINLLESFPKIKQLLHQFENLPAVVDYYTHHERSI
jgi:glutathione S-transferase